MNDHLLVADDDPDVVSALEYLLHTEGFRVSSVNTPAAILSALSASQYDLLIMDLNYSRDTTSGREGLELIEQLVKNNPLLPIVAITAWGSVDTAVKAMQAGARDFIEKPWDNDRLISVVNNQLKLQKVEQQALKLSEENQLLRGQLASTENAFVYKSEQMATLMQQIKQVSASDANVLLTGENGTGKSVLVNLLHRQSQRSSEPLISVNMGSITESLFESEMFGHVKGAFTDARDNRIGRFELAEGGTLFLDEISNTPYSQQAKLLRVLETNQFERVGSSHTQRSDCRLVCATNADLDIAVEQGSFREDLLYRINTVEIRVPALRERAEDIVPLALHFLHSFSRKYNKQDLEFDAAALEALQSYTWPGNVRELQHLVERATILAVANVIDSASLNLDSSLLKPPASKLGGQDPAAQELTLEQLEKEALRQRLIDHDGDSVQAARSLGLSKSAFYRHLKKHKL